MTTTPARPAGRYGEPGPVRRRLARAGVVVLVAAVLAWLVWVALVQARPQVTTQVQGHRVLDDTRVQVTFALTKEPGQTVRCRVEALSSAAAQVGLAVLEVGPTPRASSVQTVLVRTQQRATTGDVQGCDPV